MAIRVLHADAIVVGDSPALSDAAAVVDGRGTILDVGPASDVIPRSGGARVERFQGVIVPGLVNAHTHLELSGLRGQVPGGSGFVPWVEHLIDERAEQRPEQDASAIERAIAELEATCTVAVGEVTNSLSAVRPLARAGFVGAVFHEVFGLDAALLDARLSELPRRVMEAVGDWPSAELSYSPSPHTLYTTHLHVARRLVQEALEHGGRVSLHLAEHASERSFLETGEGPIAKWYATRWKLPRETVEVPGRSPIGLADLIGALAPHVLCIHLTDARPDELALVATRGASVVFCPRSNLHIETRLPPLLAARAAGILPALGTDSLASNASLDVLAEARALADRFTTVPAGELVRMATWEGARALGRPDLGRVVRGARPGLFVVQGPPGPDPCAFLLANLRAPRQWVADRRGVDA
jgi:cytosine/adenosine deaminase-related metal-dependent hydrolase